MTKGLGVDLVCMSEFDKTLQGSTAFIKDHFTKDEIAYSESGMSGGLSHFSARYAAKEAFIKAIDSLFLFRPKLLNQIDYKEVEIAKDPEGRPYLNFYGQLKTIIQDLNVHALLSISHDGDYAMAQVLIQTNEKN